jgi:alpha-beta hydrolase superfamily lysophospholipase
LAGWWTAPDRPSRDGVVIASPLGYEYWSSHRSLRTLAESLARAGWHTLRFDWDGTGDSAGAADDPDRVAAWRASLAHAVAAMRAAGMQRVVLIGVRLGGTLALLDAAALGVDEIVACAPVPSGKRFVKELKLLGIADPERAGHVMYAGLTIDPDTASDLAHIDLLKAVPPAVSRTLLVTRSDSANDRLSASLGAGGHNVDVRVCDEMRSMLDVPSEDATVPVGFIPPILEWLGRAGPSEPFEASDFRDSAIFVWQGARIRERFVDIDGLSALASMPADRDDPDTAVVFLNSGSEPHIGPGRAWVEYARAMALQGFECLRVDFTGWGESPDEGHAPGRPYDEHCVADTWRIVTALRRTHARVVLVGLCAGAWVALLAAQRAHVDGVFALNPQLYWQPGDPIEALMSDTHRRRTQARAREAFGGRWGFWTVLDVLGVRPMASRWLTALRKRRVSVMLSFAEGDDGLTFLRDRCRRRLARESRSGCLAVEEITGIDHQTYRLWRRDVVIAQMLRFLGSLPPARATSGP